VVQILELASIRNSPKSERDGRKLSGRTLQRAACSRGVEGHVEHLAPLID